MRIGDVRTLTADGAIGVHLIAKWGGSDGHVAQAAAATDALMGVCVSPNGATNPGDRVDIQRTGYADVICGGNVTRGDPVTSDGNGKAVTATRHTHVENTAGVYTQNATTAAAPNDRIIGFAEASGVAGDIIEVFLAPGEV